MRRNPSLLGSLHREFLEKIDPVTVAFHDFKSIIEEEAAVLKEISPRYSPSHYEKEAYAALVRAYETGFGVSEPTYRAIAHAVATLRPIAVYGMLLRTAQALDEETYRG